MRFSLDKYRFITHDNEVIAISTYAGKTVRGVAKLHPQDTFNLENGKKLAAARCNEKIAAKRFARAVKKIKEAEKAYQKEIAWYNRMVDYYNDSATALNEAKEEVKTLVENM